MSYCRWSDNSDVYCYEDCTGGFTTHVAEQRLKPGAELPDLWGNKALVDDAVFWKTIDACYEPIGLPEDGKSYNDPSLELLLERLFELRDMGYKVPEYAIEAVREELEETK